MSVTTHAPTRPTGRAASPGSVRAQAARHADAAVRVLAELAASASVPPEQRVAAATALLTLASARPGATAERTA